MFNHYIYRISCSKTLRSYIGSSCMPLYKTKSRHFCGKDNQPIYIDILRYGRNTFEVEILACNLSKHQAKGLEIEYCLKLNPSYNLTPDGQPGILSGENHHMKHAKHRERMRKLRTGSNNPMWNKTHTDEAKAKITNALLRDDNPRRITPEQRNQIRYLYKIGIRPISLIEAIADVSMATVYRHTKDMRP